MGRDSNPRYLSVNTLSRRARSTTLPPIQGLSLRGRTQGENRLPQNPHSASAFPERISGHLTPACALIFTLPQRLSFDAARAFPKRKRLRRRVGVRGSPRLLPR